MSKGRTRRQRDRPPVYSKSPWDVMKKKSLTSSEPLFSWRTPVYSAPVAVAVDAETLTREECLLSLSLEADGWYMLDPKSRVTGPYPSETLALNYLRWWFS